MSSVYIHHHQSKIHYHVAGRGKQLLFCFHGFGESANHFLFLEKELREEFTLIAIDLPFHGKTIWKESGQLQPSLLCKWIDQIAKEFNADKFSLLGYSMGGRIALSVTELMTHRINQIVLCAPDGLKENFWYRLATQTSAGNKLFKVTMKNPGWFVGMTNVGRRLGLLKAHSVKFVQYYLGDKQKRMQLYQIWTSLASFRPDLINLRSLLAKHGIRTKLIFGKYDRIIHYKYGERFRKSIEGGCEIILLEAGHQFMNEKHIREISASLKAENTA
jgi:pimeloyl-ACP methyl ester carboxylesterase